MTDDSAVPAEEGIDQLRALIDAAAGGRLPVDEFARRFRAGHEGLERRGRPRYRSRDEARPIWDVLWALEFYSADPAREANPEQWNDAAAVLGEVQRAARHLQEL
jgi:hypothetical protein